MYKVGVGGLGADYVDALVYRPLFYWVYFPLSLVAVSIGHGWLNNRLLYVFACFGRTLRFYGNRGARITGMGS